MKFSALALAVLPGYVSAFLTQSELQRSIHAVVLSQAAYDPDPTELVPGASVYTDEPDQAITHKKDNVCYVAFRGTTPNLLDWAQNFDIFPTANITSPSGKMCQTTKGFLDAYNSTEYFQALKTDVHDCAASCGDTPCEVVVTGHSQGGAIAAIAAVDMEDLNPSLITFGQPATLLDLTQGDSPCDAIDASKYLRFVNTDTDGDTLEYDLVVLPFLNGHYDWLGKLLLLSDNEGGIVTYYNGVRDGSYPSTALDLSAHFVDDYKYKLETLNIAGTFPVHGGGWVNGATCRVDTECQSDLCSNHKCVKPRGINAPCDDDEDCDSGRCDASAYISTTWVCLAKKPNGSSCNEDSDCISDRCSWFKCKN